MFLSVLLQMHSDSETCVVTHTVSVKGNARSPADMSPILLVNRDLV